MTSDARRAAGVAGDMGSGETPVLRGVAWVAGASRRFDSSSALADILGDVEARVWVDLSAPTRELVGNIAHLLQLHPLVAEDILERNQRVKIEETDGMLHVVMFELAWEGRVAATEVDLVLGSRSLVTIHDTGWDPLALPQLRADPSSLLQRGPDFLMYAIADGIVDGYFPVLDALEDEIDELQDDVIARPTKQTLERLFVLKRELISLRRVLSPSREVSGQLTNRTQELIAPAHVPYFRDVHDHLIRATDELDNDREIVAGTLEVYLSTINNNLSLIMKRLTGVTVILAGVAAITGIFGMSEAGIVFADGERIGFWLVTLGIVVLAAATALVLRRIDWI
jgi:magnesium transporter